MSMLSANRITLLSASFACIFIFSSVDIENTGGAPAGKTGSPGDNSSCTSCHSGTAATLTGAITSDIPASGYVPGNVYTISVTISDPVKNKFGFQISPQKTNGAQVGTMTITDPTRTQLTGLGKYITHKSAGTSGTANSITWSFQWTAPAPGTGSFNFYGAFLIANANNSISGDAVKLSTLSINEDTAGAASVDEIKKDIMILFPNPAKDFIECRSSESGRGIMKIFSVKGELAAEERVEEAGKIKTDVSALAAGMYIMQLEVRGKKITRKFIKD